MVKELHYSDGVFLLDTRKRVCLTPRSTHSYLRSLHNIDGSAVHVYQLRDLSLEVYVIAKENVKKVYTGEKAKEMLESFTARAGYFTCIGEYDFFSFEHAFDYEQKAYYRVRNVHNGKVIYQSRESDMSKVSRAPKEIMDGLKLQVIHHPFALYAKTLSNGLKLYVCLYNNTSGLLFITY